MLALNIAKGQIRLAKLDEKDTARTPVPQNRYLVVDL